MPEGNGLAVGTNVGTVIAFDQDGRRLWESKLAENADREILALSASSVLPLTNQPLLAATLEAEDKFANAADVVLLGSDGQTFTKISGVGSLGLTRFIEHVELSYRADFNQHFIEHMGFPEKNLW